VPRTFFAIAVLLCGSAAAQRQTTWQRKHNATLIQSPTGFVEVEWLSASTFRFQRCSSATCPSRPGVKDAIDFTVRDTGPAIEFRTEYLTAQFRKPAGTMFVQTNRGKVLLDELPLNGPPLAGIGFDRASPPGERLYGLGPRTSLQLDLRGSRVKASRPLLIASTGYGQYFSSPAVYEFDLAQAAPDRVQVRAVLTTRLEYFFYYGPTPKEILEEHVMVTGAISPISPALVSFLRPGTLPKYAVTVPPLPLAETVAWLNHASFSGVAAPAVDLGTFPDPLGAYLPLVFGPARAPRERFMPYLYTYLQEARDRGLPVFRPLAMQYANDGEAARHPDTFMIGDEILIGSGPKTYLPMGIWTHLRDGAVYKGRQIIDTPQGPGPGPALFCHNGTILPVENADRSLSLHYFPRLGAEFFLSEPGHDLPTQVHAAPAADLLRLQIESRVDREYEWIVHHVSPIVRIEPTRPFTYDTASRTLRLRTRAAAGSDVIIHVSLEEPL